MAGVQFPAIALRPEVGLQNYPAIFAGLLATNAWNWLVMKKHL